MTEMDAQSSLFLIPDVPKVNHENIQNPGTENVNSSHQFGNHESHHFGLKQNGTPSPDTGVSKNVILIKQDQNHQLILQDSSLNSSGSQELKCSDGEAGIESNVSFLRNTDGNSEYMLLAYKSSNINGIDVVLNTQRLEHVEEPFVGSNENDQTVKKSPITDSAKQVVQSARLLNNPNPIADCPKPAENPVPSLNAGVTTTGVILYSSADQNFDVTTNIESNSLKTEPMIFTKLDDCKEAVGGCTDHMVPGISNAQSNISHPDYQIAEDKPLRTKDDVLLSLGTGNITTETKTTTMTTNSETRTPGIAAGATERSLPVESKLFIEGNKNSILPTTASSSAEISHILTQSAMDSELETMAPDANIVAETLTTEEPEHVESPMKTSQSCTATGIKSRGKHQIKADIMGLSSIVEDHGRPRRKSRRLAQNDDVRTLACPVCNQMLKPGEMSTHLQTEIYKLEKLSKTRRNYESQSCSTKSTGCERLKREGDDEMPIMDSPARYKAYLKTRTRRERRLKASRKQVKVPGDEETHCPVCNETIVGTPEELTAHVDNCLQEQEADSSAEVDIEGEEFEEYTWAGQTRIRATTMLPGGLAASGFQSSKSHEDEEDIDLDIDGDDCNTYGKPQYTEADIIPCSAEEPEEEKERRALRRAVLRADGRSSSSRSIPDDRQRWQTTSDTAEDKRVHKDCENGGDEVVECLKARIRDQEAQLEKLEQPKCLICMDWYTKPLVSVQCWHVHCEECWLRTLGTKKLCPQCNSITSPADLRRVFL